MPIKLKVAHPEDNHIDIAPAFLEAGNGAITIDGKGNTVRIGVPQLCSNIYFHLHGGATLEIGDHCIFGTVQIHILCADGAVRIGTFCGFNGTSMLTVHEPAQIVLGAECLIASNVTMMASDVHHIYSLDTGERLNKAADIVLGERVWVAAGASILKDTHIGSDSVVGLGAVVSGRFPSNCILAGMPARVVRERIRWQR